MTDKPKQSPNDDELREAIADVRDRPGDLHDARILAAARLAAREHRASPPRAQRTAWLLPGLAVAASLLVAVSLTSLWLQEDVVDPSAFRNAALNVSPADGAGLPGPPTEFSWPTQAGATGYRLIVFDTQANEIWASAVSDKSRLATPSELSAQLERGQTYLWLVEVGGNVTRRELGPFTFSVDGDLE